MVYSVALRRVTAALAERGIVTRITTSGAGPFWGGAQSEWHWGSDHGVPFVEITYVDDEAIMIASRSPAALKAAYRLLLDILCRTFAEFGFVINWGEGKTECFVRFRGKRAAEHSRTLAVQPARIHRPTMGFQPARIHRPRMDFQLAAGRSIPLPAGAPGNAGARQRLRVVESYKHLGSAVDPDNRVIQDAALRTRKAMAAYAPLAVCLFGARAVSRRLRLNFAGSLVFSRLLYNVAAWPVVPLSAYQMINAVYMRVLRRIAGRMRFSSGEHGTDSVVRAALGMPSLSVLVARWRLRLLASTLRCNLKPASALLATRVPGTPHGKLPWVELLIADMRALQRGARGKLDELGCPVECAAAWHSFVLRFPGAWRDLVRAHHATTTEADTNLLRRTACGPCVAGGLRPWACQRCAGVAFFDRKGAACTHARRPWLPE